MIKTNPKKEVLNFYNNKKVSLKTTLSNIGYNYIQYLSNRNKGFLILKFKKL